MRPRKIASRVESAGYRGERLVRGSREQGTDLDVDTSGGEVSQCRTRRERGIVEMRRDREHAPHAVHRWRPCVKVRWALW